MRILGKDKITKFKEDHPKSRESLSAWEVIYTKEVVTSFKEVIDAWSPKKVRKIDSDTYLFNISHNNFRLVVQIDFEESQIIVRDVLTHQDYDKKCNRLWNKKK